MKWNWVEEVRERGVEDDSSDFGLSNRRMELPATDMGNTIGGAGLWGKIGGLGLAILSLRCS